MVEVINNSTNNINEGDLLDLLANIIISIEEAEE